MTERKDKDIDQATGVELNEHEWDGLRELNNPLPRWWLYIFYGTIAWSLVYMVLYPAVPLLTSYTKGVIGHSQRADVEEQVEALRAERAVIGEQLADMTLQEVRANGDLLTYALAAGAAAFGDNCATCHGRGAQGYVGYPNLNDDEWLWGGTLEEIYGTIRYGIRNDHPQARFNIMPAYGKDGLLTEQEIADTVEYVVDLSGREADAAAVARAATVYEQNCTVCHGPDGKGIAALGAPNLTNGIWLYGGDRASLQETIYYSRAGVMPPWLDRLDDTTIRALAIYVHSLGGGQEAGQRSAALSEDR